MFETIIAYTIVGVLTLVMAGAATYPLWKGKIDEVNSNTKQ